MRREASRAWPQRRTGRLPLAEGGEAPPTRLARTWLQPRTGSWRAFSLGRRRETRRALKRLLRLRDRQRGPAGRTLVSVGQSEAIFRIDATLVGTDAEPRRHPSS